MKKIMLIILATIFWQPAAFAAQKCETFSAVGVDYWYPYIYQNTQGQLTGIVVDATREALRRVGIKLEVQPSAPWKRILFQFQSARVDMVLGAYWNKERAAKFLYSTPIAKEEIRVFVRSGEEFSLSSFDDLKGRNGFRLQGGSLGQEFDDFARKHLTFSYVPTNDKMIEMLGHGRGEYGLQGHHQGLHFGDRLGLTGKIVALPWPILSNDVHVMINQNAACADKVDEFNAAIYEMKKSGDIEALIAKHRQGEWGGQ